MIEQDAGRSAERPVIGMTLGDLNGVGPEIVLKTIADNRLLKYCIPVIYGSLKVLNKYRKLLDLEDINYHIARSSDNLHFKKINLIPCWEEEVEIEPGKVTPYGGRYAHISLRKAADDLLTRKINAVVTAPINKANIQSAEFNFPGHTEFFTSISGVNDSLMLLVSGGLRVGVATGHIPLHQVSQTLSKEKLVSKISVLLKTLKEDFGILKPKVAVLGVNPHAGENGLLGNDEGTLITPLLEELKNKGQMVFGPFSADGFFGNRSYTKFDGVLAMYHDQGLIPFKTLAFDSGVNYTAGLPFIRTSPDHGTAYDIAGKNKANESSFREALYLAIDISKYRRSAQVPSSIEA